MKQTWLAGIMLAVVLTVPATATFAQTATAGSTATTNEDPFSANSILKRLPRLIGGTAPDGILAEPTEAEKAAGAKDVDQNIEKANTWFKNVTGLGLDELVVAAWKLFVWIVKQVLKWAWAIVAWISESVGAN